MNTKGSYKLFWGILLLGLTYPLWSAVLYPSRPGTAAIPPEVTVINTTTNYYLFTTNLFETNAYVSNYFNTNVYNDTYASNFFLTNYFVTNQYLTNLTVTNFIVNNSYMTNFFNTNIYVNDTYVSNFFTTNLYTTTIVTNYYALDTENLTVSNLVATQITVTGLSPLMIVQTDTQKKLASVSPNAYGSLTNNGAGLFGYDSTYLGSNGIIGLIENRPFTNLYVSNLFVSNNITAKNVRIQNNFVLTNQSDNLTVTNGITNLALTANTVLKADANKRISSIPNGYGALTNNGAGVVGYDPALASTNWVADYVSNNATGGGDQVWTNDGFYIRTVPQPTNAPYLHLGVDMKTNSFEGNISSFIEVASLWDGWNAYGEIFTMVQQNIPGDNFQSRFGIEAHNTNNAAMVISFESQVQGTEATGFGINMATNNWPVFIVNKHGLITGNGYQDTSLTEGSIVAVGPNGRLINTNITGGSGGGLSGTNLQASMYVKTDANTNLVSTLDGQYWTNIPQSILHLYGGNYSIVTNGTIYDIYLTNQTVALDTPNNWTASNYFGATIRGSALMTDEVDWVGPTNSIDLNYSAQFFLTYTPCSITGFVSKALSGRQLSVLTITNGASSNITLYLPTGFKLPERASSVVVSNATIGELTINVGAKSGTNAVYRQY